MNKAEYRKLQLEWEDIEFSLDHFDYPRQVEIEKLMSASGWAINPDSGLVVKAEPF